MTKRVVLLLQGGGALGAFQCGAWEAISRFIRNNGHELSVVAGASIGAINAGLIARHFHEHDCGTGALHSFWHDVAATSPAPFFPFPGEYWRAWNGLMTGLLLGNRALFSPFYANWTPAGDLLRFHMPAYRTDNAERALDKYFGEYRGDGPLLTVGLTDVATGKGVLFDSASRPITSSLLANCISIPIIFSPARIDGRYYWDYEVRSDTLVPKVFQLLQQRSRGVSGAMRRPEEYLFIVVDMFHADAGHAPTSTMDSHYRLVNILFGERLRRDMAAIREANAHLEAMERLNRLAASEESPSPLAEAVHEEYRNAVQNCGPRIEFVHIGRSPLPYEHISRDFDYSPHYLARLSAQGFDNASIALTRYREEEDLSLQRTLHASRSTAGSAARLA
jgi:NTE family protein